MSQEQEPLLVEERPYQVIERVSEAGKTRAQVRCPFCGHKVWLYARSVAGVGKRCACGAAFGWSPAVARRSTMAKGGGGGAGGAGRAREEQPFVGDRVRVEQPGNAPVDGRLISSDRGIAIVQTADGEVRANMANLTRLRRASPMQEARARQAGAQAEIRRRREISERIAAQRSEVLNEMQAMRDRKPRSLARTFGTRGPTPEERAEYDQRVKQWNSRYRALNKRQKQLGEESSRAYEAWRAIDPVRNGG